MKLEELKALGVNTIWITPIVDNIDEIMGGVAAGYHGYWAEDFEKIEPTFGNRSRIP